MNAPAHALSTLEPRRFTADEFMRLYEGDFFGRRKRVRLIMGAIYAAAGVPEYWVVDLQHQKLVVFRAPGAGGYGSQQEIERTGAIAPLCAPDAAAIAVADLF